MQSGRPLLVIVSGAPASGKTTLARRLAADGDLTLLSKDAIKEALADALGHPQSVVASSTLGVGAYAAMYAMASRLLESGVGVVLESNFRRGQSEDELTRLGPGADARAVHCAARSATIRDRYRSRASERHPAHLDAARSQDVMRDLRDGLYEPLALDWPRVVILTDDDAQSAYAGVRAFVLDRQRE